MGCFMESPPPPQEGEPSHWPGQSDRLSPAYITDTKQRAMALLLTYGRELRRLTGASAARTDKALKLGIRTIANACFFTPEALAAHDDNPESLAFSIFESGEVLVSDAIGTDLEPASPLVKVLAHEGLHFALEYAGYHSSNERSYQPGRHHRFMDTLGMMRTIEFKKTKRRK